MRLGMSLFSFQLDLIIFWRFLFLWTSFGKTTIEMPTSSSEWHIRRCPNTESRGVIKPRPKSTGLPWNFSFLFACLYKDFFFIFVFLENEDEKKKKRPLEFLWTGQLNHPLQHLHTETHTSGGLVNRFDFLCLGQFSLFSQSRAFSARGKNW